MKKCRELLRNGNKSLVEVSELETREVLKYVVCSDFDDSRKYGEKWNLGHYFDVWAAADAETQMKAATMYLYGIGTKAISYDRMSELATLLKDGLMEDDKESAIEYMKETCEFTKDEAEYFGVKEKLFPTVYKVYNVTMERRQTVEIKIVMPEDADPYNELETYIGNTYYLDPDYSEEGDWEINDYDEIDDHLDVEDFKNRYSQDEVWNYDDVEEDD